MKKSELVNVIAEKAGLTRVKAQATLDATSEAIAEALKEGKSVQIMGFGTFYVIKRAAREGINPKTKAKVMVSEKNIIKFKPGAHLDF